MARLIPCVCILIALQVAQGCSVEPRSAREVMSEGLSRALPDDQLGPRSLPEVDPNPIDALGRNPLLCARELGPVAFLSTTRYERRDKEGALRARLVESVEVERAQSGDFGLSMKRNVEGTRKSSSESKAVFAEGRFYTADSTGVFFLRNPMRAHHMSWYRDAGAPLKVLVDLVRTSLRQEASGTRLWEGREVTVHGLDAVPRVHVTPEPTVAALRDSTGTWPEWWRRVTGIESIAGEYLEDPETGCVVQATLDMKLRFLEPSTATDVLWIHHEFTLDVLAGDPKVHAPRTARLPRRDRVVQMLREVLPNPSP